MQAGEIEEKKKKKWWRDDCVLRMRKMSIFNRWILIPALDVSKKALLCRKPWDTFLDTNEQMWILRRQWWKKGLKGRRPQSKSEVQGKPDSQYISCNDEDQWSRPWMAPMAFHLRNADTAVVADLAAGTYEWRKASITIQNCYIQ